MLGGNEVRQIHELRAAAVPIREIVRRLGAARTTVRKHLRTPGLPRAKPRTPPPSRSSSPYARISTRGSPRVSPIAPSCCASSASGATQAASRSCASTCGRAGRTKAGGHPAILAARAEVYWRPLASGMVPHRDAGEWCPSPGRGQQDLYPGRRSRAGACGRQLGHHARRIRFGDGAERIGQVDAAARHGRPRPRRWR